MKTKGITEEILVSKLVFIQAPAGFLEQMSTQVARWFYNVEAHPVWFMGYDWRICVSDSVAPEWVALFRALAESPPDYEDAFACLKDLRAERSNWMDEHGYSARIGVIGGQRVMV